MKIDIGRGKILGTKRVSPNGQVSGFLEYAGREVLVILPETEPEVELAPAETVEALREAVLEQMTAAFGRYRGLKERFHTPNEATKRFLDTHAPRSFGGLYGRVESWVTEQVDQAERTVERKLEKPDRGEPR